MTTLYQTFRADIIAAVKARDSNTATILRTNDGAIQRAAMDANKEIDDAMVLAVLRKAVKNLTDAMAEFERGGRPDLVALNRAELEVLAKYLPAQMEEVKLGVIVEAAIAEVGATSKRDMGRIMGVIKRHPDAGSIDFGMAGRLVAARLP